jgi:hypothetical protein
MTRSTSTRNATRSRRRLWQATGAAAVLGSAVALFFWKPWKLQPHELFQEFQMFPSARTFDPPGTVFRVNPENIRYDVIDLSPRLATLLPVGRNSYPINPDVGG